MVDVEAVAAEAIKNNLMQPISFLLLNRLYFLSLLQSNHSYIFLPITCLPAKAGSEKIFLKNKGGEVIFFFLLQTGFQNDKNTQRIKTRNP
jgi:hypothetical protein